MKTRRDSGVATSDRLGECEAMDLTRKGIETALCDEIVRFEQEYMGRQPERVHAHFLGNLLLVRLQGVLTAAEKAMAQAPTEEGLVLLKQIRNTLIETSRPIMEAMVEKFVGTRVLSLHHDVSTATGEEVLIFTLVETPKFT